jgi:CO/xanthine dehydrogenase FAD-binding subunit
MRVSLDLHAFGWVPLRETEDGLTIAATCTLAELARWQPRDPGRDGAALLARQCCHALLGSFKVQNVAAIGGNTCLSRPASPMTSLTAALDVVATLLGRSGGTREISIADLVTGDGRNALAPGELLTDVSVPAAALTARTAFRQLSLSPLGRSTVLVIARRDQGRRTGARTGTTAVTITAATPRPVQLRFAEPPPAAEAMAALEAAAPPYLDDVHGAGTRRAAMTRRLVAETVTEFSG